MTVFFLVTINGEVSWSVETGGAVFSSPVKIGHQLLFGCHDSNIYCLNIKSRSFDWKTKVNENVLFLITL